MGGELGDLTLHEAGEEAIDPHQFLERTLLHDPPGLDDVDSVRLTDRTQSMGDEDARYLQPVQALRDDGL